MRHGTGTRGDTAGARWAARRLLRPARWRVRTRRGAGLAATALIGLAAVAWAGRRRDFRALLGAAALAQVAFHIALSLSPAHGQQHVGLDLRMLVGHAVATVVMAAVVARGEAVLDACSRAVRGLGVRAPVPLVSDRPLPVPRAVRRTVVATGLLHAPAHPRRGPPDAAAA